MICFIALALVLLNFFKKRKTKKSLFLGLAKNNLREKLNLLKNKNKNFY